MTALVAAFSLQDKIEQYGAYAGIAAVFGLGVLSLLYFAQAREVKRLRDWAGRAPERAAELEARVQADAQRRAAAQQPPRPAAPVTPAAQQQAPATGAAAPATAAAAASGTGSHPPSTTATKPATASPQNGTGSGAAVPPPGTEAKPAEPGEGKQEGDGNGKTGGDGKPVAGTPAAPAPSTPAAKGAPAPPAPGAPAADKPAAPAPATPGQPETKPPEPEAKPSVPAAATAAAAGAARPQPAAPLRAPTPAASLPPRTPAGAGPATGGDGRSRGQLAAIIGGAFAAVAIVVVVALLLFGGGGDDNSPPAPNTVAQPGATGAQSGSKATPPKPAAKLVRKDFPLAVLNGTTVTGLARGAADKLTAKGYNEPNVVTNDPTNQTRAATEILFEAKARAAALDVAKILGVKSASVKPMDANARALADRATVVVFVGADKAQ